MTNEPGRGLKLKLNIFVVELRRLPPFLGVDTMGAH
jgi:hypothetical protein